MIRKFLFIAVLSFAVLLVFLCRRNPSETGPVEEAPVTEYATVLDPEPVVTTSNLPPSGMISNAVLAEASPDQKTLDAMRDHLDECDDVLALEAARQLTKHENRTIRMEALLAMHWIGGTATFDVTAFFDDPDPEIRAYAEEVYNDALEDLEDPALEVTMLTHSLKSSLPSVRLLALEELVFLPEHLSFKPTASALNDSNKEVRDLARENLEFISTEVFSTEADALAWLQTNEGTLKSLNEIQ